MTGKSHAHSSNKIHTLTPLAAAVVAALSPTLPVLAQEEAARLDEVIVTATKREVNLQDVPHSIDVLSALDLQKMGAKDLEATLRALPSMHLTALQPGQNSLVVRGIPPDRTSTAPKHRSPFISTNNQ
jgi:outer membrane receptor for ferrienterochelin and colicin